jgi:hypothetical protein
MKASHPAPLPEKITEFLELLYPDEMHETVALSNRHALAIWDKAGGTSWLQDGTTAAQEVAARSLDGDAYFHVCLHSWELVKEANPDADFRKSRGCATSATVIPGLWADIDHKGGAHKREALPESLGQIMSVLEGFPLEPTAVVDTGGGVHVYWLFADPLILSTHDQRQLAYEANQRLQLALRDLFAAKGMEGVDFAHDLARVLRLPGTINHKYGKTVTMLPMYDGDRPRYSLDRMVEVLPELPAESERAHDASSTPAVAVEGLTIRGDGKAPERLTEMLAMGYADPTLEQTWRRERKVYRGTGPRNGTLADSSASSYTLSLAMRMLALGDWSDQELADAIVAWRTMHGEMVKGGRLMSTAELQRRVGLTISKAREWAGRMTPDNFDMQPLDSKSEDPVSELARSELAMRADSREDTAPVEVPGDDERDHLLGKISEAIGTRIVRVEREVIDTSTGGVYTLVLPPESGSSVEERVEIGQASALLNPIVVRAKVLDGTGRMIARMKPQKWDPIALAIRECAITPHDTETMQESYRDMLREYLQRNLEESATSLAGGTNSRRPVVLPSSNRAAIKSGHLAEWASMRPGMEQRTGRSWSRVLRSAGLGKSQTVRVDGTEESRFVTFESVTSLGVRLTPEEA